MSTSSSQSPQKRPKGGRGKRGNYESKAFWVPLPLEDKVLALIDEFHKEVQRYDSLPLEGKWYEVLGVLPSASEDEVRTAYLVFAKRFHPDQTRFRKDYARSRFEAARRAYEQFQEQ